MGVVTTKTIPAAEQAVPEQGRWPFRRQIIRGCDERGDGDSPYLTRWILLRCPWGSLYLHLFHRSDADVMHDHPWDFLTLVLWRGYTEEFPGGSRRVWPGQILRRPATWVHRVMLLGGKPALTLNWVSPKKRSWGFHTPTGWVRWREYFERMGC